LIPVKATWVDGSSGITATTPHIALEPQIQACTLLANCRMNPNTDFERGNRGLTSWDSPARLHTFA
jgi:hypothetical protein